MVLNHGESRSMKVVGDSLQSYFCGEDLGVLV